MYIVNPVLLDLTIFDKSYSQWMGLLLRKTESVALAHTMICENNNYSLVVAQYSTCCPSKVDYWVGAAWDRRPCLRDQASSCRTLFKPWSSWGQGRNPQHFTWNKDQRTTHHQHCFTSWACCCWGSRPRYGSPGLMGIRLQTWDTVLLG